MPHRFTVLALAVLLLAAMPSLAATVNVAVGGASFSYSPQEVHIHPGDTVTWTNAGGGDDHPGTLRFSLAGYSVNEGAGTATITVQRVNGDDGAVSVQYAATAGTATAGQDFTPASGPLSWAAGDDAARTFTMAIANDTTAEPGETVLLALAPVQDDNDFATCP